MASTKPAGMKPKSDSSDRLRHSRHISASRLAAVESPGARSSLLSRVGKVFGRKDDRVQRLAELVKSRQDILSEAGRHALGLGGGLGLPEEAVLSLLQGNPVTIRPEELSASELEVWRTQRQRLTLVDAEIAALRQALDLGPDPESIVQSAPPLRPDQKAQQESTFAALDGMGTEDLEGDITETDVDLPPPVVVPVKPPPALGNRNRNLRRRR
jgi:hypothetical protein